MSEAGDIGITTIPEFESRILLLMFDIISKGLIQTKISDTLM